MLPRPDVAHPELGFYTLAGAPETTRALIDEVREAEDLGLGYAFVSERYYKKEAAVQSGAVGAVSEKIAIATGVTNHNTRHPMVTAGYAHTMQSLTGGRFVLGLGRGIARMQDAFGLGRILHGGHAGRVAARRILCQRLRSQCAAELGYGVPVPA